MAKVIISDFNGGMAEDIRELSTNTFAYARNYDVYSASAHIERYKSLETETIGVAGPITDYALTDVIIHTDSIRTNFFALGKESSVSSKAQIFQKGSPFTLDIAFQPCSNGIAASGSVIPGTLCSYKQKLYYMSVSGSSTLVQSYDLVTATSSLVGTISATANVFPRPFRHPQDDYLYFGAGNIIAKFDGTTFTPAALTLPSDLVITSITNYNAYLAIAQAPKNQGRGSVVALWGRDTTLNTLQDSLDWGEGSLNILENIGGVLIGVSSPVYGTGNTNALSLNPKITIRGYAGGSVEMIKELKASGGLLQTYLPVLKQKQGDKLYFSMILSVQGTELQNLWVIFKNKSGKWTVSPDRKLLNDTAVTTIQGFSLIGDYLWSAVNSNGTFYRTLSGGVTTTYPISVVRTLVNPNMPLEDRAKRKQLQAVSLKSSTGGSFTIRYSIDFGTTWKDIATNVTLSAGQTFETTNEATSLPFNESFDYQFEIEAQSGTGQCSIEMFEYRYENMDSLTDTTAGFGQM